ncbi:uncharacterized protein LOC106648721 [Trichogramma pretiosum]|uniref:uncharacterized protein LOC106648721 n=1 Tax=Trichogramma pretiosum TaxID=7493 RepID=UPI0006C96161|nr:uncharacterized protein LOC106648721 [Trichogramma pretiosum]
MDDEKKILIDAIRREQAYLKSVIKAADREVLDQKSIDLSVESRKIANEYYCKKKHSSDDHHTIFEFYCKCIAFAPNHSQELAIGYQNRSAFLFHIEKYEHCLQDINKAISFGFSTQKIEKLLLRKAECLKILGENKEKNLDTKSKHDKYEKDILHAVKIECNEKYGNHLIAKKDFNPGDIIFSEKIYAKCLSLHRIYTHCCVCLSVCWSGVPCKNCCNAMFCSDICQEKSKLFHDEECLLITSLLDFNEEIVDEYSLSIRLLTLAIKEAGGLAALKSEFQANLKYADKNWKFDTVDKQYSPVFQNLFKMCDSYTVQDTNDLKIIMTILVYILKKTHLINFFKINSPEDILTNEDILLIGSLYIKFVKIKAANAYEYSDPLINQQSYFPDNFVTEGEETPHSMSKMRGVCIAQIASLINHNCFPNVGRYYTEDNYITIYALLPIQKNEQLFVSYCSIYYSASKLERSDYLKPYNFDCDCTACQKNWAPNSISRYNKYLQALKDKKVSSLEIEIYECVFPIIDNYPGIVRDKEIKTLAESLKKLIENVSLPNQLIEIIYYYLKKMIIATNNFKELEILVFCIVKCRFFCKSVNLKSYYNNYCIKMEKYAPVLIEALKSDKVTTILDAWGDQIRTKSSEAFIEAKKEGNKLFVSKDHNSEIHEKIWKHYSKCVAHARSSNEFALAYGNRSALLFHIGKFRDSVRDIDRALQQDVSDSLKIKLLCRKAKCLVLLNIHDLDPLSEAKELLKTVSCQKQNLTLSNLVLKTEKFLIDKREDLFDKPCASNLGGKSPCFLSSYSDSTIHDDNKDPIQEEVKHILEKKNHSNVLDLVTVQYNRKYGRHMIANQNIAPGEIIIVEDIYVKVINLENKHVFCGHCLQTAWSGIPCDYCTWCIFCSEKCKEQSLQQYHKKECLVISYMLHIGANYTDHRLALRSILMAINEYGSITKLMERVKELDNMKEETMKGIQNGKKSSKIFEGIYSLASIDTKEQIDNSLDITILCLIILTKTSSLFGKSSNFYKKEHFHSNEEIIFIGYLLMKLLAISRINAHSIMEGVDCRHSKTSTQCSVDLCCDRGACIATYSSLVNHSCHPNIRKCFTKDMQIVIYAIRPIQKYSQLFDCYIGSFQETPKDTRQSKLISTYNFTCMCIACKNNWPNILLDKHALTSICNQSDNKKELEILEEYGNLMDWHDLKSDQIDLKTVQRLSQAIEKSSKLLTQPSFITSRLMASLASTIDCIFGIKLQLTDECIDS